MFVLLSQQGQHRVITKTAAVHVVTPDPGSADLGQADPNTINLDLNPSSTSRSL